MELGEKIYTLRSRARYSQENFAEALGVSRQSVSRWENGTAVPDTEYIIKMCRLLGVSTDELLLREELPPVIERVPMSDEEIRERASLDTLTLIGFVLSFFVCVAGLIVSAIAVARWKRMGEVSERATAGVAIGAAETLFLLIAVVLLAAFLAVPNGGGGI